MPARAAFKARIGHHHRSAIGEIDAVRTARALITLTKPGKGRMVDRDLLRDRLSAENPLLAVEEHRVAHHQIAHFGADSRAIAVSDAHLAEHDAIDGRALPAQHERRLALAGRALEDRSPRRHRFEGDMPARLHGALVIDARRDQDRRRPHPHRLHRFVDRLEGLPRLGNGKRRARLLRGGGGRKGDGDERKNAAHEARLLCAKRCPPTRRRGRYIEG
ncbi:hypothetical protein D9M73_151350 [compost metagenome]